MSAYRFFLAGLCLALPLALSGGLASADPVATFGAWTLYRGDIGHTAVTTLPGGEKFGLLCLDRNEHCVFFIKPMLPCEDGRRVPVRLQGEAGSWRLRGLCTEVETGFLLVFDEDVDALVRGSGAVEARVKMPGSSGKTLHFEITGGATAVDQAREAHARDRRDAVPTSRPARG